MMYQLLICMYLLYIFLGADYADGGSREGSTSKEKGTFTVMRGETCCTSYLYVCTVLHIFLGADYADGDSTEGSTSKEKGTYNC